MILGRFGDTSKRPYVEGRLSLPSQRLNTNISFVLDTGADRTVLMPMDGTKMGIDYDKLTRECSSRGVGGFAKNYLDAAIIAFRDVDGTIYSYKIDLMIAAPTNDNMNIPALLGRDIINRWRINYDPIIDTLECHVNNADISMGPSGPKAPLLKPSLKRR